MNKHLKKPATVLLEKGKVYAWCTCGRTERMPFCDGLHKGTEFKPKIFEAKEAKEYKLCNCGNTKNAPYCDGTHLRFRTN